MSHQNIRIAYLGLFLPRFCVSGHCSICLHDTTPELRPAYTTTRIIPVAKHATFQIPSSGVGCWYRMRDPRCLRMTFGIFPELEKGTGMLMFCLTSWQMGVPLQTIRLLAQVHLQGEGDAKSSHF